MIHLGRRGNNGVLYITCGCCVGYVAVHVILVGGCGTWQMGLDQLGRDTRDGGKLFTMLECSKEGWCWQEAKALVNVVDIFGSR